MKSKRKNAPDVIEQTDSVLNDIREEELIESMEMEDVDPQPSAPQSLPEEIDVKSAASETVKENVVKEPVFLESGEHLKVLSSVRNEISSVELVFFKENGEPLLTLPGKLTGNLSLLHPAVITFSIYDLTPGDILIDHRGHIVAWWKIVLASGQVFMIKFKDFDSSNVHKLVLRD
ncbi:MAG: hypothetical protein QW835_00435 [Candidatus Hadarchaeum sp.]